MGVDPNPIRSVASLSDMVKEFFEDAKEENWPGSRCNDGGGSSDDEEEDCGSAAERKAFWDSQHELLHDALSRTSSTDAKIRIATEEAARKMQSMGNVCTCPNRSNRECCRNCVLRYIADQLRDAEYNSALCKCKWRRSLDIPSGEHSYIDVVVEGKNRKRGPTRRVVIELNFRAEFEMARAGLEYNSLVSRLPEVFVGKSEKLQNVIKIMCGAAKKCMKDNKMHMGPWRKHKYMQSKWLGSCERMPSPTPLPPVKTSDRPPKSRASLLTFDLHCTAVEVV